VFTSFKKYFIGFRENPVWTKVLLFCLTLFLIWLADGIISFWAPIQIQNSLNNSFVMGLVISFQSIVGLFADLIFPSLLKFVKVRKLISLGILFIVITSMLLFASTFWPFVLLFLVTMAFWGVYYEFISFASFQFMGSSVPLSMRSGAWGVSGIFGNLAYFLGPLMAAFLMTKGFIATEAAILALLGLACLVFSATGHVHENQVDIDLRSANPWEEIKHWGSLSRAVWPMIIMSTVLGFADSTFWTIGAIWTEKLSRQSPWGVFFLPLYMLPAIFVGLIVARWGIYKGKKILSEKLLILAGVFMVLLAIKVDIYWQLAMVFLIALVLSFCYPLVNGTYSDIVARMGKEKKDMIGLTSSVVNLAYIVWPPIAGLLVGIVGEQRTFAVVGVISIVTAIILLFVTPKKLRLPQTEIKEWEQN
jgi:MFS family permease